MLLDTAAPFIHNRRISGAAPASGKVSLIGGLPLVRGVVVVELVFSFDVLVWEAITALIDQNLPVIVGIVLFGTLAVVLANLVVDLLYAVLDPRIRLG
jgi:ABC-type dipeptide/oligopeptide/nickel transport system permease component